MVKQYDFCGYATKNDLLCADGRTIRRDAFKECDGTTVPLVWNHRHDDPEMVLGHAYLENRKDGVYMYGKFNDTERGQTCKKILQNKDINGLSIHANHLKQRAGDVLHGVIKEVSLVLSGANPGALIDFAVSHSDDGEEEVYAYLIGDEFTELEHGDIELEFDEPVEVDDEEDTPEEALEETVEHSEEDSEEEIKMARNREFMHADDDDQEESKSSGKDETVQDVINTLTDKQKTAVYALLAAASGDTDDEDDEENETMKHNAFEEYYDDAPDVLSHADMELIIDDAKRMGSLRDAVEAHMEEGVLMHADEDYGITRGTGTNNYFVRDPEMLFPDYKALSNTPEFIRRDTSWVTSFMSSVKHTPFSRIKTLFADITIDDARALGYIKGNQKKDEFFNLIKRTTDPQTVYKRQRMDRDDVIDITDFDVVAWIKGEMRDMLDEEIARACLIGDGRDASSEDKISENHVRSVLNDADLFTIKISLEDQEADSATAKAFVKAIIQNRKDYKGTGNPDLFISDEMLAKLLTMEDGNGRFIYETEAHIKTALRVNNIIPNPLLGGTEFSIDGDTHTVAGILLNPIDYVIGADKGGAVNMFDDFDIDYNRMIYLIETRISGALVKPKSAMVIGLKKSA